MGEWLFSRRDSTIFHHSNPRNRCAHLRESHRTLRDGVWGGAVPGTSCQATIAPSLRDISQQALIKLNSLYADTFLPHLSPLTPDSAP